MATFFNGAAEPRENPNRHFSVEGLNGEGLPIQHVCRKAQFLLHTFAHAVASDRPHDDSKLSVWVFVRLRRLPRVKCRFNKMHLATQRRKLACGAGIQRFDHRPGV